MNAFTLRPSTIADEPFLRALFRSTREALLESMPCDDTQRAAICDMQFRAQTMSYRDMYPQASSLIVADEDGQPIGRLTQALEDGILVLVDIALLPQARRRGIGSALLRALQEEADCRGVPLVLSVDVSNPASRLYRRLGFEAVSRDEFRMHMRWSPPAKTEKGGRGAWTHS